MSKNKISFDYYEEGGSLLIDFGSRPEEETTTLTSDSFVIISPASDDNGISSIEILLDNREVAEKIAKIFEKKK